MCPLKKCCVSFVLALLLSSVSLVPCFASDKVTGSDFTVNTDDTLCTVEAFVNIIGAVGDFPVPVNELLIMDTGYDATTAHFPVVPSFSSISNFILTEDVTLYWRVAPFLYDDLGVSNANIWVQDNINTYLPKVYVGSGYNGVSNPDQPTTEVYVDALSLGNGNYGNVGCRAYRCTIPAIRPNGYFTEQFTIVYPGFDESDPNGNHAHWNTQGATGSLFLDIPLFTFVHTTDKAILSVLDDILASLDESNVNTANILAALDNIIVKLDALGVSTEHISQQLIHANQTLSRMDSALTYIKFSVESIEYMLTTALAEESESLDSSVSEAVDMIQNVEDADTMYYEFTTGIFEQLTFENGFSAGLHTALGTVGQVFTGIWGVFDAGDAVVMLTFPLILGISLLVIGRIGRTSGMNQDRKKDGASDG